ncbi:VacJ family lipoprotein [uncultured Shewanella sp.]|uniref:MlaA family lipoprotein n=1 Tax=uncultured Shewanella sp. TaxID=173975 RepID=UPI0026213509|nr:VacJ family lipoprotein [uncultured Shewanella sp.]
MTFKWIALTVGFSLTAFSPSILAEESKADESKDVTVTYNDPRDPIEGFNRAMWDFNYLYLDKYIYRPIVHSYQDYIPRPVRTGIYNVVLNLDEPSSVVNNTLQGKWMWAANAAGRFTVNSTLGIFGVFDVADKMGMPRKQDTLSEVMGYYGVPDGPYFMAPFLGPYITREIAFDWVDSLYFPMTEFTLWQKFLKWGIEGISKRTAVIDQERLVDNALDPYTFVKDAYFQYVDYKVYDGDVPQKANDDALLDDYMQELD